MEISAFNTWTSLVEHLIRLGSEMRIHEMTFVQRMHNLDGDSVVIETQHGNFYSNSFSQSVGGLWDCLMGQNTNSTYHFYYFFSAVRCGHWAHLMERSVAIDEIFHLRRTSVAEKGTLESLSNYALESSKSKVWLRFTRTASSEISMRRAQGAWQAKTWPIW